jgi:epoxyqueuosine reductase QueG
VSKSTLEQIADRERAAIELAERTRAQISELTERLTALEQQIAHAAIAGLRT